MKGDVGGGGGGERGGEGRCRWEGGRAVKGEGAERRCSWRERVVEGEGGGVRCGVGWGGGG